MNKFRSSDTLGYKTFDKDGNLINEIWYSMMCCDISYKYDSNQLLIFKEFFTDYSTRYDITYKFIDDSLKLYQFWSRKTKDTSIFRFNKNGKIIEAIEYYHNTDKRNLHHTFYEYNSDDLLSKKIVNVIVDSIYLKIFEEKNGTTLYTKEISNYYYTQKKLDSCITNHQSKTRPKSNYESKKYYDKNGLLIKQTLWDGLIYTYLYTYRNK